MSNVFERSGIGQPALATEKTRADQIKNSTGGFGFQVDDKTRLMRFLILGTDGGSYYTTEKELTKDNVNFLIDLITRNESMVIDTVVAVSTSGRAYRNSPAIFAVAAIAVYGQKPYAATKLTALLKAVCRTSTHLFEFAQYLELLGGWGPAKRAAVANWYIDKPVDSLAYQVVKYRQRNGWTHRDMLRLSHPVGLDAGVRDFILGKETTGHPLISGFKLLQSQTNIEYVIENLRLYPELPWEAVPTQFLTDKRVWQQLFINGQLRGQALLRNITRLSRIGTFDDMVFAREYATALVDEEMMARTRLHPFQYLLALKVHTEGQVVRDDATISRYFSYASRTKNWTTSPVIVDALNDGFHKSFKFVEPTGKRTMLCLDVSGSMSSSMSGMDITAAETVAAMAMVVARTEPYYHVIGFANEIRDLGISPNMSLTEIMGRTHDSNFGATDPSAAIVYAQSRKIAVDTFVVMTDNEVNRGRHVYQTLQTYRKVMGINARLVVVACTPTNFSIADPNDAGMLDICGGDANLPALIADFSAGRI